MRAHRYGFAPELTIGRQARAIDIIIKTHKAKKSINEYAFQIWPVNGTFVAFISNERLFRIQFAGAEVTASVTTPVNAKAAAAGKDSLIRIQA